MRLWSFLVAVFSRRHPRLPHRPRAWWRRLPFPRALGIFIFVLGAHSGCDSCQPPPTWRPALERIGLAPEQPKPKFLIEGLLDPSLGSPGSDKEIFRTVVHATAEVAARFPGSMVRWTTLGASLDTTRVLGEKVSPPLPRRGARAIGEAAEHFARDTTEFFVAAAEPAFAKKPLRASPILGALGKTATLDTHGLEQHRLFLVLSDAREVSDLADFECMPLKRLPTGSTWERATARLIPRGSLNGAEVFFAYATVAPTLRTGHCPEASVERTLRTQELMRSALTQAGVGRVMFASGLPELLPAAGSPLPAR